MSYWEILSSKKSQFFLLAHCMNYVEICVLSLCLISVQEELIWAPTILRGAGELNCLVHMWYHKVGKISRDKEHFGYKQYWRGWGIPLFDIQVKEEIFAGHGFFRTSCILTVIIFNLDADFILHAYITQQLLVCAQPILTKERLKRLCKWKNSLLTHNKYKRRRMTASYSVPNITVGRFSSNYN